MLSRLRELVYKALGEGFLTPKEYHTFVALAAKDPELVTAFMKQSLGADNDHQRLRRDGLNAQFVKEALKKKGES